MRSKNRCIIKVIIAIILIVIPLFVISYEKNSMSVQNTYLRWDSKGKSAHISAFMSEEIKFSTDNVYELEEKVRNALLQNDALDRKSGGRSWADCYSSNGKVSIEYNGRNMEADAFGVGGDFFLFHPLQLLNGSYFSDENVMQDLVVIDEDVAWRIFGSSDVSGMMIEINGSQYIVSGVIKQSRGNLNKAAGNSNPTIYMSFNSLKKSNEGAVITSYEIVMPNLTKNYAKKIIKENLDIDKKHCEIIDNSERYSVVSLYKIIRGFAESSMKTNTVCYPYWENVARGKENICALWLLIETVIILLILILLIKAIIKFYKKNSDEIQNKWNFIKDFIREIPEKLLGIINKKKSAESSDDGLLNNQKNENIKNNEGNESKGNFDNEKYSATVIFDIGNVLAEFIPEKFLECKGYYGEINKSLMETVIESDLWNEYDKGIITKEELIDKYINEVPWFKDDVKKIFGNLNGIIKKFKYTDEWIDTLKNKNVRVLFLSNLSETLYLDCKKELDFLNKMHGGILSFEAKCIKPDKKIYEKLIEEYNLTPDKCIFVDDRETNVTSGINVGFNSILFTSYEETNDKIMKLLDKWK